MERQEGDGVLNGWSGAYYAFPEVVPVRGSSWGFYTAEGLLQARQERQSRELGIALAREAEREGGACQ